MHDTVQERERIELRLVWNMECGTGADRERRSIDEFTADAGGRCRLELASQNLGLSLVLSAQEATHAPKIAVDSVGVGDSFQVRNAPHVARRNFTRGVRAMHAGQREIARVE